MSHPLSRLLQRLRGQQSGLPPAQPEKQDKPNVFVKELSDNISSVRMLVLELLVVLTALAALRGATTARQDLDRLNNAIGHLGEALDPDVWADSIHGTANGDEIFGETKNAAISILAMLNDSSSTVSKSALQQILSRIVIDDRLVALTAINDAVARGANTRNIDKARAELASGDADIAANRVESGLEHYRNAWSFAVKA